MNCRLLFVNGLSLGHGISGQWQLAIRRATFPLLVFLNQGVEGDYKCRLSIRTLSGCPKWHYDGV